LFAPKNPRFRANARSHSKEPSVYEQKYYDMSKKEQIRSNNEQINEQKKSRLMSKT
jgi:hypothetical protein